jgi:crossover junction endodeoxyribonuclease RuvC
VVPSKTRSAAPRRGNDASANDQLDRPIIREATPNKSKFQAAVGDRVIGVDLGSAGALALLVDGDLVEVADMPILRDGPNSRPTVNPALLAPFFRRWNPRIAYIEFVSARPGEGPTGAFAFGRSRGCIEGVLGALAVPVAWITAPAWKRALGLSFASKDAARSEAIRRWPAQAELFARVRDDGRAESALIAVAGLLREARQ